MIRRGWPVLVVLLLAVQAWSPASNLMQQVSTKDPAYTALRLLDRHGLLADTRYILFSELSSTTLTRYDVAFALIEPLRQFIALTDSRGGDVPPETLHRRDVAYRLLSGLTPHDRIQVLATALQLTQDFADAIDELTPGLTKKAMPALRTLQQTPDLRNAQMTGRSDRSVHLSVDTRAELETFGNPLPLLPTRRPDPNGQPMSTGGALYVRPANSLEAAVDVALGRVRFYGTLATLPGQSTNFIIRPELSGTAVVGVQFDFLKINDLGISGILEYHVQRTNGTGADDGDTNVGGVTGIGIRW